MADEDLEDKDIVDLEDTDGDDANDDADDTDADGDDAGDTDGDADDDADGDGEGEPAAKASRGGARFQKLSNETKEAKRLAAEAKAESDRLKEQLAAATSRVNHGPTPEQLAAEQARIDAMDPVDRAIYMSKKDTERLQQQIQGLHFQQVDSADKAEFNLLVSKNPALARYSKTVEDALAGVRAKGNTAPRQTLLEWAVGREAVQKLLKGDSKGARKAAASRVSSSKGKSLSVRGDVNSSRGRGDDVESRLRGVVF